MMLRSFTMLALALASLPIAGKAQSVLISSYFDDPFVGPSVIKRMDPAKFGQARDGRPTLYSNRVLVTDEDFISRKDKAGVFGKFAFNPWWWQAWTNPRWDLTFPDEQRFPVFRPLRGSDNQIVLKDGLQVWIPQDLNLGYTTAFEAANAETGMQMRGSEAIANGIDDARDLTPTRFRKRANATSETC